MATPKKVIVDLSKPKGEREQIVDLTAEEIAERDARAAAEEQAQIDAAAAAAAKEEKAASARQKLTDLGLTEEEIAALLG